MIYLGRFKSYCIAVAACFLSLPGLAFAEPCFCSRGNFHSRRRRKKYEQRCKS